MTDKSLKQGINIGTSSLILIFIILCLAVFGLLSLSSAKSDMSLANQNAEAVKAYYEADSKGQEFLKEIDSILKEVMDTSAEPAICRPLLEKQAGRYYDSELDCIKTEIPMDRGQALYIELKPVYEKDIRYTVEAWKVINTEEYEIDDSMPVWDGVSGG